MIWEKFLLTRGPKGRVSLFLENPAPRQKKNQPEKIRREITHLPQVKMEWLTKHKIPLHQPKPVRGGSSSSKSTGQVINITIEECGDDIRQGKARSHLDTLLDTSQCKKKTIAKSESAWKCETGSNQTKFCDNQLASFCFRKYTCVEETKDYNRAKFGKEDEVESAQPVFSAIIEA